MLKHFYKRTKTLLVILGVLILVGAGILIWAKASGRLRSSADTGQLCVNYQAYLTPELTSVVTKSISLVLQNVTPTISQATSQTATNFASMPIKFNQQDSYTIKNYMATTGVVPPSVLQQILPKYIENNLLQSSAPLGFYMGSKISQIGLQYPGLVLKTIQVVQNTGAPKVTLYNNEYTDGYANITASIQPTLYNGSSIGGKIVVTGKLKLSTISLSASAQWACANQSYDPNNRTASMNGNGQLSENVNFSWQGFNLSLNNSISGFGGSFNYKKAF